MPGGVRCGEQIGKTCLARRVPDTRTSFTAKGMHRIAGLIAGSFRRSNASADRAGNDWESAQFTYLLALGRITQQGYGNVAHGITSLCR